MVAKRAKKSPADIKAELDKTLLKAGALRQRLYATELDELIKTQDIVSKFKQIKYDLEVVDDLTILAAIARAVGIKRLVLTQAEVKPRTKKAPKSVVKK